MNFERILFATDLSDQSRHAAPHVRAFANRFQSDVILLYVLEPPPAWSGFPETQSWQTIETVSQLRDTQRAELTEFLPDMFAGLTVDRILAEGDAAQQILCHSRRNKASLIMMPTHGRGPFRSLLLGSVTAKVLHDAECPVWTGVHRPEWAHHSPDRCRKILCAVDAAPQDIRTAAWAAEFAKDQHAEVRLVHGLGVIPEDSGRFSGETLHGFLTETAANQLEKLQAGAQTDFEVTILEGSPASVVHDAATHWNADLVVVGRGAIQRPLGRLRSNAYAIIRESPCPVISV